MDGTEDRSVRARARAAKVRRLLERRLGGFPTAVHVRDWTGDRYRIGRGEPHWSGRDLDLELKTVEAGERILARDPMGFLHRYLAGEVEIEGNLYVLSDLVRHGRFDFSLLRAVPHYLSHRAFQDSRRARANVKSHYDVPQEALDVYLDRVYLAYSCAWFEAPDRFDRDEALRPGEGRGDDFDSLEKAQWRKFQDAIDFVAPAESDVLLDVGCGYGGQLRVALESHAFRKVVGWTHSDNQVERGRKMLAPYDAERWEILQGDYREDGRIYDHVTSTGMVSHVGPRGLVPYVRHIRRRIKRGGRYLHHALMRGWTGPVELSVGPAFNKRYVWPGFHWFTPGQHVRALESNGFVVRGMRNLSPHYAKTGFAWYERMMEGAEIERRLLGEPGFRAWRIYLAGGTGGLLNHGIQVHRIYCEAV